MPDHSGADPSNSKRVFHQFVSRLHDHHVGRVNPDHKLTCKQYDPVDLYFDGKFIAIPVLSVGPNLQLRSQGLLCRYGGQVRFRVDQ